MSGVQILVSDYEGIYVPMKFVERFEWSGINFEDLEIIKEGPENEYYWVAWDNVMNDAFHNDKNGFTWRLYQDGDLFAYCDQTMTNEEYKNLFGVERD